MPNQKLTRDWVIENKVHIIPALREGGLQDRLDGPLRTAVLLKARVECGYNDNTTNATIWNSITNIFYKL